MMLYEEYLKLSPAEQEAKMWKEGVAIAVRHDRFYHYQLIQLDGFYIELVYSADDNVIKKFIPFNDLKKLDPYLDGLVVSYR